MATFIVNGSDDMTALDLSTILNGTVTTNTSSLLRITATDGSIFTFGGDFTGGSGSTLPTGGTITNWVQHMSDGDQVDITGLNLSVADFDHFLQTGNATALQNEMFSGNDFFNLSHSSGATDVSAGAGNDAFFMGGAMTAADVLNGGGGVNVVELAGNYENLTLTDNSLTGIDGLKLSGDNTYNITTADGNVAAHRTLVVDAKHIGAGTLTFNGSAETDGRFDFILGTANGFTVTGGAGNDIFHGAGSGATLNGGGGNDSFIFGGNFDGTDTIDGGTGFNALSLHGDYSAGLTFGAGTLQNIDDVALQRGTDYNLTFDAANNVSGDTMRVDGHTLFGADTLTADAAAATGRMILEGGNGADTLIGGSGGDTFDGGRGADSLTAGTGADSFFYSTVNESIGVLHDTVTGFDADQDSFALPAIVAAIDTSVVTGRLSDATFNGDMSRALDAAHLHTGDAVLFTPDSGTDAGNTYLVVDTNGTAGYQANQDMVIALNGATHLADLSTANFTVG